MAMAMMGRTSGDQCSCAKYATFCFKSSCIMFPAVHARTNAATSISPESFVTTSEMMALLRSKSATLKIDAQGKASGTLHFEVKPEYHINSHKPSNELLIPTELVTPQGPVKLSAQYPEGHDILLLGTEKVNVYSGKFDLQVSADAKNAPAKSVLPVELKYQACNNNSCFPPKSLKFEVEVVR